MFGPVHNFDQRGPVGFFAKVGAAGLGAGDDGAVESVAQKFSAAGIEIIQMLLARFVAGKIGQREKLQADGEVAGGFAEEFEELKFGVFERGIGHVVDQRDAQRCGFGMRRLRGGEALGEFEKRRDSAPLDRDWHFSSSPP